MKRLCIICARGDSKGVVNKNLRLLGGRPLIAWSILQAHESGLFEAVAVSSDSALILEEAAQAGADHLIVRPPEMATDQAAKLPAIRHALLETERSMGTRFEVLVDLDATAPLRITDDIVGAVAMLEHEKRSCVVTGSPARRSPYFNLVELDEAGNAVPSKRLDKPAMRHQDAPRVFDLNGSIQVWSRDAFMHGQTLFYPDTGLYEMPRERSVDIDSELDFTFVTLLFERTRTSGKQA